jgi:GNAT superfamily N-acetyltransferase
VAIQFRPVGLTDLPAMAAIRAQEWGTEDYWRDRIAMYLRGEQSPGQALPERAAVAAVEGTRLLGFAAGHRTRRFGCDGELQWVHVVESSRGQGIAVRLIREIGAWFVEQGARRICVNVEPDNLAARQLYQRCGAEPLAGRSHWMIWEDSRAMLVD